MFIYVRLSLGETSLPEEGLRWGDNTYLLKAEVIFNEIAHFEDSLHFEHQQPELA